MDWLHLSDHEFAGGPQLGNWSELHLLVAIVKDGVILAHEDVTHNPERAIWSRDIEANEGEEALTLHLNDVIVGCELEWLASKGDVEVGEGGNFAAIHDVLLARKAGGSSCCCELGDHVRWAGKHRSAAVDDGLG